MPQIKVTFSGLAPDRKIAGIKSIRALTGLSLKDAKDLAEASKNGSQSFIVNHTSTAGANEQDTQEEIYYLKSLCASLTFSQTFEQDVTSLLEQAAIAAIKDGQHRLAIQILEIVS